MCLAGCSKAGVRDPPPGSLVLTSPADMCHPDRTHPPCACRQELDSARQAAATHQKEAELRSAQAQQRKEVAERLAREVRGMLLLSF